MITRPLGWACVAGVSRIAPRMPDASSFNLAEVAFTSLPRLRAGTPGRSILPTAAPVLPHPLTGPVAELVKSTLEAPINEYDFRRSGLARGGGAGIACTAVAGRAYFLGR